MWRSFAGNYRSTGWRRSVLTVGENLSYEDERITSGTAEELKDKTFAPLAVLLLEDPDGGQEIVTHGIPDEEFLRDQVPMTKFEVRAVSLSRLELKRDSIVYDVGAGPGCCFGGSGQTGGRGDGLCHRAEAGGSGAD